MANLKDIRDRIKSVKSIQKVTKAMKMVAAAQARPYSIRLTEIIQNLLPDVDRGLLPLLNVREVKRVAYVVVTSDKGLAGSFNSSVLRKTQNEIDEFGKENVDVFCIGKKARDHFKSRGYTIIESHVNFWGNLNFNDAIKIGNGIVSHFLNENVDEIRVVYNEFVNVASQMVLTEQLLPLEYEADDKTVIDRLYEPSKDEIVKSLVPRHLNVQMWKYLLESYASEQAARMVAMENATTNSENMINDLTLEFNKVRQATITTEMLEIVSGAEALKG